MAAAQVQSADIDDAMEFFARYVSEWNTNKGGTGIEKGRPHGRAGEQGQCEPHGRGQR